MTYKKVLWINEQTRLNATNLNHIEEGIFSASEAINGLTTIIPNNIGVQNNKLCLLHDAELLPNQSAINLEGFQYDEGTNTLKTISNVVVTFED